MSEFNPRGGKFVRREQGKAGGRSGGRSNDESGAGARRGRGGAAGAAKKGGQRNRPGKETRTQARKARST